MISDRALKLAQLIDLLPENYQNLIISMVEELIYLWDAESTEESSDEIKQVKEVWEQGYSFVEDDEDR